MKERDRTITGPNGEKRSKDPVQAAHQVVKMATGQIPKDGRHRERKSR